MKKFTFTPKNCCRLAAGVVLTALVVWGIYALVKSPESPFYDNSRNKYSYRTELEGNMDYVSEYLGDELLERYVEDRWTKKRILNDLSWLEYSSSDSLVAFAMHERRGYLNLRSREIRQLDEKFVKIYLFKEGRALAESLDSLYLLDTHMNEVARYERTGDFETEVKSFHKGHMPMLGEDGKLGLIDTCGHWAIEPQYDKVSYALEEFWLGITEAVLVDEETGESLPPHRIVMDSQLRTVMEGEWTYLMVSKEGYITVADKNHWQWHYDLSGHLINDFVCNNVQQLSYLTGEKKWVGSENQPDSPLTQVDVEAYAELLMYETSDGWSGLMTRDGKVVTPPNFWSIQAIGKHLYLCKYDTTSDHGILLNDRGERVHH